MRTGTIVVLIFALLITAAVAQDGATLKAEGDKTWPHRDSQASLQKSIDAYEKAVAAGENNEAMYIRLAIAYYWKGNNLKAGGSKDQRKTAYEKGMEYAQKAVELNPNSAGGNFWYATNLASFGREKGILKSVGMLPELKKRLELVTKVEKYYYYGGPQRLYSRIITKAPGMLRKQFGYTIEQAENELKNAIAKYPNFTMSHLFLADVYIDQGKKDLAKQELEKVLATPENSMPEFAAENRRDKKVAKALLAKGL